jgi:ParB/RepB/Spo0J family partition protein
MARKAGLPTAAVASLSERRATRGERDLIEAAVAGLDSGGIKVALDDIADHPENTRHTIGDVSDIKATLTTVGLLQAPVVLTRAAFLKVYPQHAAQIGTCRYVALIGHRRLKACREVGWTEVEVRVADHLIGGDGIDIETMVIENVHRKNLNPIEEARAMAALLSRRPQREIAQRLGYSQSYISKRLKLLDLIPDIQTALTDGWEDPATGTRENLPVSQASIYAAEDPALQQDAWALVTSRGLRAGAAIAEAKQSRDRAARLEQTRRRAEEEGLELVDPDSLGEVERGHRLHDTEEIDAARKAGTLRAAADARGDFVYLSTAVPTTPAGRPPRQRGDDDAERRAATSARAAACRRIAGRKPAAADALRRLALCVADRSGAYTDALRLAHQWLQASDVGPDTHDHLIFRDAIVRSEDDQLVTHLAVAMALAYDEMRARDANREWDAADAAHIQRLVTDASYQPTAWELDRLARINASVIPLESPHDGADDPLAAAS